MAITVISDLSHVVIRNDDWPEKADAMVFMYFGCGYVSTVTFTGKTATADALATFDANLDNTVEMRVYDSIGLIREYRDGTVD